MNNAIELSEELLLKAGGWREFKEARQIHRAGAVSEVKYEDGLLEALVPQKGRPTKVRLKIHSATNMENFCPCYPARRDGIICAHVLAAGLELIEPQSTGDSDAVESKNAAPVQTQKVELSDAWPVCCEEAEEAAVPAELFVILPPNLSSAWEKSRILAGIEFAAESDRKLLAAAKTGQRLFLGPRDAALFAALQEISPAAVPGMMQLGRDDFLKLLEALAGHPRVSFGRKEPVRVAFTPFRPTLELSGGKRFAVAWPENVTPLIGESAAWAVSGNSIQPAAPDLPERFRPIFDRGLVIDPADSLTAMATLQNAFEIDEATLEQLPEPAVPEIELDLQGSLNRINARLSFHYGSEKTSAAGDRKPRFVESGDRILVTSPAIEDRAITELERYGFSGPDPEGKQTILDRNGVLQFFAHHFPKLDGAWKITTGAGFEAAASQVEPVTAVFDFQTSGENWFEMGVEFESQSAGPIPRNEIQRLIQSGRCDRKASGKIAVIDPALVDDLGEVIADCDPHQERPGTFRIDRQQAGYLRETAGDLSARLKGELPWQESAVGKIAFPEELDGVLRPYQRAGVEWLLALANRGMGGILADDMGLGKTLQTLALIRAIGGRTLVVCPSSLVFNWIAEAKKFVPDLKAVAIDGPDRAERLAGPGANADLLVTSYALLRLDAETWQKHEFDIVILDEAQQIRNPDAQVSKAAHRLKARHRFALTGTPIENSVRDLWSILQFALPGYLGSRQEFAERFEKPIGKGDAPALGRRLSRRLRPVVLRRLKREVATELPEKIEQVVFCELNPGQRAIYDQILGESRESIFDAEGGRKRMLALTALLRLRQACCDLRLLGLPDIEPDEASIKSEALEEMLTEAVEGGHRILIFSQFVQMLQVLVPLLAERGLKFCFLDGRTKRRGEEVAKFQDNDDIPVFLISLKAGGVGLNLTAADTVIHIDPWWNPAVEAQATDRAHRIGQERVVTSYKLIARNTVEEKILALQEKKKAMMESILDSGADAGDAALTEEEMLGLFED